MTDLKQYESSEYPGGYALEQAQEFIEFLKDELDNALGTIEFLHGCLTEPQTYLYLYPSMTEAKIERLRSILQGREPKCVHSKTVPGCASCAQGVLIRARRAKFDQDVDD